MNRLMTRTNVKRRKWIVESRLLVSEVLVKFPCLTQSIMVSSPLFYMHTFKQIPYIHVYIASM